MRGGRLLCRLVFGIEILETGVWGLGFGVGRCWRVEELLDGGTLRTVESST